VVSFVVVAAPMSACDCALDGAESPAASVPPSARLRL
jgi:hypothetical protein